MEDGDENTGSALERQENRMRLQNAATLLEILQSKLSGTSEIKKLEEDRGKQPAKKSEPPARKNETESTPEPAD